MSTTHPTRGGRVKSIRRSNSRAGRSERSVPVLIRLPDLNTQSPAPVSKEGSTVPTPPQEQATTTSEAPRADAPGSVAAGNVPNEGGSDPPQEPSRQDSGLWQGVGYKAGLSIALIVGTIGTYVILAGGSSDRSADDPSDWHRQIDHLETWAEADDGLDGKISVELPPVEPPRAVATATNEPDKENADRESGSSTNHRDEVPTEDLPELLGPQRPEPESANLYSNGDDSFGNINPYMSERTADQSGHSREPYNTASWPSRNNPVPDFPAAQDTSPRPMRYPDTGKQEYDLVPNPRPQRQAQLPEDAYPMPAHGFGSPRRGALQGTIQNPDIRPNYEHTGSGLY